VSSRSGATEIWLCDGSGHNAARLTSIGALTGSPRWSPDGERIAFDSNVEGHWEIYVINANGGSPQRLTIGRTSSSSPAWSGDGKWIYFVSTRGGESQVWKAPSGGGPPIQVTQKGGFRALESPAGKFLYYMKSDDLLSYTKNDLIGGLWRMPIEGGEEVRILESLKPRAFEVVQEGVYFFAPGRSDETLLQFHAFSTKKTTLIGVLEKVGNHLDVAPDRHSILYTQIDEAGGDLMLVEGFR
jgi:dipeptidyl aminopeptidase/acylaminoacyl peptidase